MADSVNSTAMVDGPQPLHSRRNEIARLDYMVRAISLLGKVSLATPGQQIQIGCPVDVNPTDPALPAIALKVPPSPSPAAR